MKRIELTGRELFDLIKNNESNLEGFLNKPISEFTYEDFLYCVQYNGDNLFVAEFDDYELPNSNKLDFTGFKKVREFKPEK